MDFLALQILGNSLKATNSSMKCCHHFRIYMTFAHRPWKVLICLREMLIGAWKIYQKICKLFYQQLPTQFLLKLTIQSQRRAQKTSSMTLLQWWGWSVESPVVYISHKTWFHTSLSMLCKWRKKHSEHCVSSSKCCRLRTPSSCAAQASASSCFLAL